MLEELITLGQLETFSGATVTHKCVVDLDLPEHHECDSTESEAAGRDSFRFTGHTATRFMESQGQ